ncbi:hypothetical protein OOJ09_29440 [Mesorhizobium qingshengii]|uniref:Uncharacterized protein n=1 Tax=Mesorhizobium qingshengii TaxID=1165689 RepID=A0ABT4R3B6_9HYPH|nr:hypothetical protein [Mesorhizobium qingshengii]MCZ8548315.1 hypothetical protein [Mesorhizobium qingshengii]
MVDANRIVFADIQSYLDGIADNPKNTRKVDDAGHARFWRVSYHEFITGFVPDETCKGQDVPIVNSDPAQCPFYQALVAPAGWCNMRQMPRGGPFITDAGYAVTLGGGLLITGVEMDANIRWWLTNGMPEV